MIRRLRVSIAVTREHELERRRLPTAPGRICILKSRRRVASIFGARTRLARWAISLESMRFHSLVTYGPGEAAGFADTQSHFHAGKARAGVSFLKGFLVLAKDPQLHWRRSGPYHFAVQRVSPVAGLFGPRLNGGGTAALPLTTSVLTRNGRSTAVSIPSTRVLEMISWHRR